MLLTEEKTLKKILTGEKRNDTRIVQYAGITKVYTLKWLPGSNNQDFDWGIYSSLDSRIELSRWIFNNVWGIRSPSDKVIHRLADDFILRLGDQFSLGQQELKQELQIISYQTGRQFLLGHEYDISHFLQPA